MKKKWLCLEASVVTKDQVFPFGFAIMLLDIKHIYQKIWVSSIIIVYDLCNIPFL